SNPGLPQESGSRREPPISTVSTSSLSPVVPFETAPTQAAPVPTSQATDHSELSEFASLVGKFAGEEKHAASIPTPSKGQTDPAAPASRPEARASSNLVPTFESPGPADFSSQPGKFVGEDFPATTVPTAFTGQVGMD